MCYLEELARQPCKPQREEIPALLMGVQVHWWGPVSRAGLTSTRFLGQSRAQRRKLGIGKQELDQPADGVSVRSRSPVPGGVAAEGHTHGR